MYGRAVKLGAWVLVPALAGTFGCGAVLGLDDFQDSPGGQGGAGGGSTTSTSSGTSSTTTSSSGGGGQGGTPDACGNGTLDDGETCDGDCPTECIDPDLCTSEKLAGSAATCDATCPLDPIVVCKSNDGCCPTGCFHGNDNDCDPKVIVLAWDSSLAQVKSALDATGLFGQIDVFNAQMTTPTLAELSGHDVALVYAFVAWSNAAAIGDVLADFYDAGGRVVVANGANCADQYRIRGRFEAEGYHVVEEGGVNPNADTLGTILEPESPLLVGVTAIDAVVHCVVTPTPGSTAVATYTMSGAPVAVRGKVKGKNRVDVNLLPSSEYPEADAVRLLANALLYPSSP